MTKAVVFTLLFLGGSAFSELLAANEPTVRELARNIDEMRSDIADFKLARADSWMFWMGVFMTLSAVVVAAIFGLVGFVNALSLNSFRAEMRENRDEILSMRESLEGMKERASNLTSDISRVHDEVVGKAGATHSNIGDTSSYNERPTLAVDPQVDQLIAEAVDSLNQGNIGEAIYKWQEVAEATKEKNPDIHVDALYEVSSLLAQGNDFTASLEAAQNAVDADNSRAEGWLNLGWSKLNLRMNAQALRDLEHAATIQPDMPMIWNNIGLAKCNLGRFAQSITDFDKAISLNSEFALAWNNKGWARLNMGLYREAVSDLKIALQCEPYNYLSIGNLSVAYRLLGQPEEAIKLTSEAFEYNPNDSASLTNRARTWLEMRKLDKAKNDLELAEKIATEQGNLEVLAAISENFQLLAELEKNHSD